jgi:hypothetical protein
VFAGFEPDAVARFDEADVERLMADAGIIRNRAKILATMGNARLVEAMAPGELDALMWSFAPSPRPTGERPARFADVPATTAASDALSKALKKRGFRFVGRRRCTRSCSRRAWSMTTSSGAIARREAAPARARAYPRSRGHAVRDPAFRCCAARGHHHLVPPRRRIGAVRGASLRVGADELSHRRRIARGSAVALHQGGIRRERSPARTSAR